MMRLKIDRASVNLFGACAEIPARPNSDRARAYCAQEPYRAVLICRNGLTLSELAGEVVDAAIGEAVGEAELVRAANVGQRHTQITIFGRLPDTPPEKMLAQVLVDGERDHERRTQA